MKKKVFCTIVMALMALCAIAVPAKPGITKELTLTDGTTVMATLVGDEYGHFWLAADGKAYLDIDGSETYRQVDRQEITKRTQARRAQINSRRMKRLSPKHLGGTGNMTGKKKGLIILVNFSNKSFQAANNKALYQRIANEKNFSYGNFKGSMYDYFYAQSEGKFELTFDVVGPVEVSQKQSYYGANDSDGNDKHPAEMVIEALKKADSDVNFADYDWDRDGEVEQVYVVYAGKGEADGGATTTIWPHEWQLSSANYYGDGEGAQTLDGVIIDTYACGGELNGSSAIAGIGTMCHEFSHCLGYPDFYDTDYSGGQGMGYWDLMDSGSYNDDGYQPAGYTSYERWVAGWKTPIELTTTQTVSNMMALQDGGKSYVIYNQGNRNEYFLLENRQLTGWDESIPGSGLLILHVDYDANAWADNTANDTPSHQRMTWIAADNKYKYTMQNGTKYYDFDDMANDTYPYGTVNAFGKSTTPAAKFYNKNSDNTYYLDSSVEDITQNADGTISFNFKGEDDNTGGGGGDEQLMEETIDFTKQGYEDTQMVTSVSGINCTITFDGGGNNYVPKYYNNGKALRLYASNSMTIASSVKAIVKVELTFGSSDGTNEITTNVPTYSNGTWTSSAGVTSVTFTVGGSTGNRRIKKVKVTYSDDEPINTTLAYYKNADGKMGEELKTALCGIIYDRTQKSEDYLWTAFFTTDVRSDGKIWDMYSNITNYTPVTTGSNFSAENDCYNREHAFPQSWFGNAAPMLTDLHHVYPTDGYVNNRRSSNPYGETSNPTWTSANDFSKLGKCTYPGGYTGTIFEPADEYKGDFARTYFYMVTCYEEKLYDWYTNFGNTTEVSAVLDGSTYPGLTSWQLAMLLEWAEKDPVSEKETARNNAVYSIQKNRNPFIDYPGLEQYIWGTMTENTFSYDHYVSPAYMQYVKMSFSSSTADAMLGENFTAPTLSTTPANLTVTYSSSAPGVATVDAATGAVTLVAVGTTVITATFAGNDTYKAASASYTLTVWAAGVPGNYYELVTDASMLAAGDQILIAYVKNDAASQILQALGKTQKSNNRSSGSVTLNGDGTITPSDDVQVITLEEEGGKFLFNVGKGYLYAASSKDNYLRTETTADANAKATISISSGNATIKFQGSNTRNILCYNNNGGAPLFSCYGSLSSAVSLPQIYRLLPSIMLGDVNGDGKVTPSDAIMILYHYFDVEQEGFNVAAADVTGDGMVTPSDAIEVLYIYFGTGQGNGSQEVQQSLDPQ